jgi:hypothetical protein
LFKTHIRNDLHKPALLQTEVLEFNSLIPNFTSRTIINFLNILTPTTKTSKKYDSTEMKISYVLDQGEDHGPWEVSDEPAKRKSFSHSNGTPIAGHCLQLHVLQVITPNNRLFCDGPYYTEIMASFELLPVNRTGTNKKNSFFRLSSVSTSQIGVRVHVFFCRVGLTSPGTAATSGLLYSPR